VVTRQPAHREKNSRILPPEDSGKILDWSLRCANLALQTFPAVSTNPLDGH